LAPRATLALKTTVARHATNKDDDDDDKNKKQSSSKGQTVTGDCKPVENHRCAAAPRERPETSDRHLVLVQAAYEKATGNRWNKSDSEAYSENRIKKVPVDRIISILEAVARRTPAKINSFNYFVQEIVAIPDSRNRAWKKKQHEKIVRRIRDSTVGHAGYSAIDFLEDVKCACAREGVQFDDDIFNELVG
jgi:hypothetical protein